jgi:hypothetical protein
VVDILIPPWVRVSGGRLNFLSNTASAASIFTGAVQTLDRTGDRVAFSFRTQNANRREDAPTGAFLESLAAWLRGQSARVLCTDPAYRPRGSFPAGELLSNPTFDGTRGWTASSAGISISSTDRVLRSVRVNTSTDETIRADVATTVNGATYALRVFARPSYGTMDFRLRAGTSAGGNELGETTDQTTPGMKTFVFAATGTSTHVSIVDGTTSRSIGYFMDFAYVSLSRCARVNGASQTGTNLVIDQLPVSTVGLARMGDWVQIENQLYKLAGSLDSDSSGNGVLQLTYPPRSNVGPADNAAVIFHEPMGRFVASTNEHGYECEPGVFTGHDFAFIEALDQ